MAGENNTGAEPPKPAHPAAQPQAHAPTEQEQRAAREREAQARAVPQRPRTPVSMRTVAVVSRLHALFRATATDPLLRQQLVTDPAQVISEYVHRQTLTAQQASVANQFLY